MYPVRDAPFTTLRELPTHTHYLRSLALEVAKLAQQRIVIFELERTDSLGRRTAGRHGHAALQGCVDLPRASRQRRHGPLHARDASGGVGDLALRLDDLGLDLIAPLQACARLRFVARAKRCFRGRVRLRRGRL